MNKKLKVAITGSIGSGKSSFCNLLAQKGYPLISADEESKKILAEDKKVKAEIIKSFGEQAFINGEINKKYLAEKIFSDQQNVIAVNSILHPKVIKRVEFLLDEILAQYNIAFVEAALIYEAEMEYLFDYVVLITSEENTRMQRKLNFDNFTREDFLKRNASQIPDEEKMKRADFVFVNNGTMQDLDQKANLLLLTLKGLLTVNA